MNWGVALALPLAIAGCNRAGPSNVSAARGPNSASANAAAPAAARSVGANAAGEAAMRPRKVEGVDLSRKPGQPPLEETYPDAAGMPRDVQAYIVRWNDCQHWAGEPGFDAARRRQIEEAVKEICTGVDDLGRRVRARHAGDQAVLARLKDYDTLEN